MGKIYLLFVLSIVSVFSTPAQTSYKPSDNSAAISKTDVYVDAAKTNSEPVRTTDRVNERERLDFQNTLVVAMKKSLSVISSARPLKGKSLGSFSTGDPVIDSFIEEACLRYDIDPLLIYAQMSQESSFKKKATSYKGASGLMQLMPATARRFGVTNIYDPKQNIEAGVKYMRWLLNEFDGNMQLALAGYNAGEGAVKKYDNQIPPYRETQNYVYRILNNYARIRQ